MEKIVTIIQARAGSSRLPRKIYLPLCGAPLLVRMVERVKNAKLVGQVVVATTTDPIDDSTSELCERHAIAYYRGHPTDLIDRHLRCAEKYSANVVIKIPSDCPLIDPAVIDRVITTYLSSDADFVSNLHPNTYPDGQDVEVMSMNALTRAWKEANRNFEREHTTPYIWENQDKFKIINVEWETGVDYSMSHRQTIDYEEDYQVIRQIYENLYPQKPRFGLSDILELQKRSPEIFAPNLKYAGVNWYRHHIDELKTINPRQTKKIND